MSRPNARQSLRQRALKAMISEAFFDWKSAVILALTLILTVLTPSILPGWQWWYWLVGGLIAWGALFASMVTDPAFGAHAVAKMLRQDFDPERLRNKQSQVRMEKALEYQERITEASRRAREGLLREHLQETSRQIEDWIANLYSLALRLDAYESDDVIRQDLRSVPKAIENLRARLKTEDDPTVSEQIEHTIRAKEQQLTSLKKLENMMEKAELQMDNTITALGTVYSQLLLVGVKDIDSGRAQRLREDISEQVSQLHDLVSSVDEVYAHRA